MANAPRFIAAQFCVLSVAICASTAHGAPTRSADQPDFNPTVDAARLVQQATFGANRAEINRIAALGAPAWITEQFAKPQVSHKAKITALQNAGYKPWEATMPSLWKQFFEGDDQLRQRVTFALSQIAVVSLRNNKLLDNPCGPGSYVDTLGQHAFGNFRDLLKAITLHPAMGEYLDMKKSGKVTTVTNPDGTEVSFYPNENYARELLQLFSLGTYMLNLDGSLKLDGTGKPIASYDEPTVQGFAKAFTGWNFAPDSRDKDAGKPHRWIWQFYPGAPDFPDEAVQRDIFCKMWSEPMQPWIGNRQQLGKYDVCDAQAAAGQTVQWATCQKPDLPPPHDTGTKKLLLGATLPAGQTPMQDIDGAIDSIFNHPNVGPFIGKQLIQRLTMSNPQPPYVERVAKAFNDNGLGVRGDMKAVVRAILMDQDVRLDQRADGPLAGKLKEPVVRYVQYLRAFDGKIGAGKEYSFWDFGGADNLNQSPLQAASVFNFYHPDARLPGQPAYAPVLAPEFELATANAVSGWADFSGYAMIKGFGSWYTGADAAKAVNVNHTAYIALAQSNPTQLIDELNILLTGGKMSANFRTKLIDAANKLPIDGTTPASERLYMVLWLIVNSPEFLIQK